MTTDLSFKPYLQTAYHTIDINENGILSNAEIAAVQNGTFKFNYKYTTCGGSTITQTYTYNGATIKAYNSPTDFALLELVSSVSNNYALTWLGWDRSSSIPTSGTAIHHPQGTPMKISYEYNSFSSCDYNSSGVYNHWLVYFDDGVVKHGSSGSPILNQNKRVVGQLHGNDQYNYKLSYCIQPRAQYGKFNLSWTGGGTNSTRLSNWLDPVGTNQTTINSCHPIGSIIGDNFICSYKDYYINNLPSGYTVSWSLSDSYYNQNCLQQNYPAQNQCTITRSSSYNMMNATLTAEIKYNGVTIQTLTKTGIYAYNDFYGQYTSDNLSGTINYTHIFYVKPGFTTVVTSPNFIGATVTYDSNGTTPSYFYLEPTTWKLYFTMPTNNNGTPVIINVNDGCGNYYQLYAMPQAYLYLEITNGEDEINITLHEEGDDSSESLALDLPWSVEICNAASGMVMATRSSTDRSVSIPTSAWPKGVYVIKATVGKTELTEKVVIK